MSSGIEIPYYPAVLSHRLKLSYDNINIEIAVFIATNGSISKEPWTKPKATSQQRISQTMQAFGTMRLEISWLEQ